VTGSKYVFMRSHVTGVIRALSSHLFQGEYETVRGDRVEARSEAPRGGGVWGVGVPLPRDGGSGVLPPGKF